MHHRGHEVGEVGGPPHPAQAAVGVVVGQRRRSLQEQGRQRRGELYRVADRQVEALGPAGRDDVRRVPGQEQATVPHRPGDEAAHRRYRLVGDPPLADRPAREREPLLQLGPDPVI